MAALEYLFDPSVIPADLTAAMPSGYTIRPLARTDSSKGFFQCLEGLTWCGDVSDNEFIERFDEMKACHGTYYFVVIEHSSKIVGTGLMFFERKLIHSCCKVGHIEEICIDQEHRKAGLGIKLLNTLNGISKSLGAEKNILNCGPQTAPFYVKCGFESTGLEMSCKFTDTGKP